jgi:DNA-binding GntR family transcriptional regulator
MARASDLAYQTVRQWILDGELTPGQRLFEEEIAQRVGVSRTSLRDCLRRLAADGLVRTEASRGTFVLALDTSEVDEVFQLRSLLEGHAASLAAERADDSTLGELDAVVDEIDDLLGSGLEGAQLFARFQGCNTRFHQALLSASGSPRLTALARPLLELPLVTLKQHAWPGEVSVRRSNQQHRELIEALRSRDVTLARLRAQSHILSARPRAMVSTLASPYRTPGTPGTAATPVA